MEKVLKNIQSASRMNSFNSKWLLCSYKMKWKKPERKTSSESRYIVENKIVQWLGETNGIIRRLFGESQVRYLSHKIGEKGWEDIVPIWWSE